MKKSIIKVLFLALMISSVLCGCNGSKAVTKRAESLFSSLKGLNYDEVGSYVYPDSKIAVPIPKEESSKSSLDAVYKRMEYKINSVSSEKNSATVNVTFKTPDLTRVYLKIFDSLKNGEDIASSQESFIAKYAQLVSEAPMKETTLDIPFERLQGNWFLKPTEEFAQLFTGDQEDITKNVELE